MSHRQERWLIGRPDGRANFSLPRSWGFRGQLEGSPERRIASVGTVHMAGATLVGCAHLWYGSNLSDRLQGRLRCVVRECQMHDARMRLDDAPADAASSVMRPSHRATSTCQRIGGYREGCNGRGKQAAVRCGITIPLPSSVLDESKRS